MHDIERELIKVTDYKVQRKFADRQDYLKSLFNAAQKLSDDAFDNLSDEAAKWLNDCVTAYNTSRKADLPDFDEVQDDGLGDSDEETSETEVDDDIEGAEGDEEGDEEDDGGSEPVIDEPAPRKKAVKAKAKAKKEKEPKLDVPKPVKKEKRIKDDPPAEYAEDAVLDKWGCLVGSKNALALALFEKGATTREVKEKLGGTYYNILGKMEQRGHRLEKEGSGFIKLTHKDDVKVSSRKPKK